MDNFQFFPFDLATLPYVIITLIVAFTLHEYAHAYVAYKFGDPTAKNEGRLTFSPLAHLDPFGTILIILAGFGWAKPVPVNRAYFKNPRLAGVLVSVAGPLSNLFLAFFGILMTVLLYKTGLTTVLPEGYAIELLTFFGIFIQLNVVLFIFNLLPFPPLDGYRIIEDLATQRIRRQLMKYEGYGIIVFLILWITPLGDYTILPLFGAGTAIAQNIIISLLG